MKRNPWENQPSALKGRHGCLQNSFQNPRWRHFQAQTTLLPWGISTVQHPKDGLCTHKVRKAKPWHQMSYAPPMSSKLAQKKTELDQSSATRSHHHQQEHTNYRHHLCVFFPHQCFSLQLSALVDQPFWLICSHFPTTWQYQNFEKSA